MRRTFLTLAVVAIIALVAAVPASAQTWVQLRYWSTNQLFSSPVTATWDSALWGFSVRRNVMGGLWALSFNYDSGGITNPVGVIAPPDSYNRFWNLNLHRNFPFATGNASLYGGVGSLAIEIPAFPAYVRQRGPRVGADLRFALPGNWFAVGDLAYTFNGTAEQLSYTVGGTLPLSATAVEYRVGLGYSMGRWGFEGGYRVINWNYTTAAFCFGAASCSSRWSGWYTGLNFTAP